VNEDCHCGQSAVFVNPKGVFALDQGDPQGGQEALQGAAEPLVARIVNCLQTILELEPLVRTMELGRFLLPEFSALKEFLGDLDGVSLDEDDVSRIETATERFLHELMSPVPASGMDVWKTATLQ